MSENESGFYKLKDDVQQAFLFVDEIVKLVDSPNPSRAKTDIKHLIEFRDRAKQCLIDLVGKRLTDDEAIAEIKRLQTNQNRFDAASANYDPFQDKYKLENIDHAISFRDIVATYLGCSYDRNEAIAKIEQLKRNATYTLEQQNLETFWRKIRVLFGNTEIDFESAYNRIVDLLHNPEQFTGDKDREIERLNRCLSEIVDILNRANTECLDHYRSKQEEKIVLTGFRGLCDIHAALFKKRSDYEIYGSRIINDLLNSVDLQAQKQAYDQEEIKRIDKDREIERLNRCISGIASFLDLPSDAKQPDICFAIMELRQKYKKISREPSSYEQIVIVDWIARLVGK
jgi:hypothetical protein